MCFCGGQSEESSRYVATVSDDKMLMVWDLNPSVNIASPGSPGGGDLEDSPGRPQPTAYVLSFPHPLTSVDSHPTTSKELLVSDLRGSIFLIDWRSDPDDDDRNGWRSSSVLELVEPRALSDSLIGLSSKLTGCASWQRDSVDLIGATYGSKFAIWDMTNLRGGKPNVSGISFPEGGHVFRWCPTHPEYFAIAGNSPNKGAVIHVHHIGHVQVPPVVFCIGQRPLFVRTFDFLTGDDMPRVAAGVGRNIMIFNIGIDT